MKSITSVSLIPKENYQEVVDGIYQIGEQFVTTLSFELEPELGEGANASEVSQYPLEDLLDYFGVYISDFYPERNTSDSLRVYLQFASFERSAIERLRGLINQRVYHCLVERDGHDVLELVIEEEAV